MKHATGRLCKKGDCRGILRDSIINFGETLPPEALGKGKQQSKLCDLAICLGSSLTVRPACNLPLYATKNKEGDIVIVNLQKTPLDSDCSLRIFAKCDQVMALLMKELGYTIPQFPRSYYTRMLEIGNTFEDINKEVQNHNFYDWTFYLKSADGSSCDFIKKLEIALHETFLPSKVTLTYEPFEITKTGWGEFDINVTLYFYGKKQPILFKHHLNLSKNSKANVEIDLSMEIETLDSLSIEDSESSSS